MSPSIPVPSKGALRALRQIALGTSCTIAFGAGLMTEDRRRRIHAAREVTENARRIKTSRKYHSAGAPAAATFEEQIESYYQYGPWRNDDKHRTLDSTWDGDSSERALHNEPVKLEAEPYPESKKPALAESQSVDKPGLGKAIQNAGIYSDLASERKWLSRHLRLKNSASSTFELFNRQRRLASYMMEVLRVDSDADAAETAVAAFFDSFPEGVAIQNVGKPLMEACLMLAQACKQHAKIDIFIPVLQKILACGAIEEQTYYKLEAIPVLNRLLERSGTTSTSNTAKDLEKVEEAVAIFRAMFLEKPKLYPLQMNDIGIQLSNATFQAGLYELTDNVFWRMMNGILGDDVPFGLHNVLLASSRRGLHKQVIIYFDQFFARSKPTDQAEYETMVSTAVDTALRLRRFDKAEEILLIASRVGEAGGLISSTTWLLQLLGEHWRTMQDLSSTQALFDRLEVLLNSSSSRFTMYSAIIQFCVEAGREDEAQKYIKRLKASRDGADLDVRTHGHLALAKAKRKDWRGVEADFTVMKSLGLHSSSHHTATFVPILQLFAGSHDIGQVEGFVYRYIEDLGVAPDEYVLNVMIDVYCKAGEIDCIPKWIEYVQSFGKGVDAVTFNTILTTLWKKWSLPLDQLFACCERIKSIDSTLVNTRTTAILRAVAVTQEHKIPHFRHGVRMKAMSLQPSTTSTRNGNEHLGIRMNEALALGMPTKAIQAYKRALKLKAPITPWMVAMAVTASIQCSVSGNLDRAIDILKGASSRGIDVKVAISRLVLVQMESLVWENNNPESVILETLATLQNRGMEITLPVISTLVSMHVDGGRYREALNLFDSLSSTYAISDDSLDLVMLTILLRASTLLPDFRYIRWIVKVLSQNGIVPDKRFKLVLVNARRRARKYIDGNTPDVVKEELTLLDEIVERVNAQRSELRGKRQEAMEKTLQIMEMAAMANRDAEGGCESADKIRMVRC